MSIFLTRFNAATLGAIGLGLAISATAQTPPVAKPAASAAPTGQVYRCGNQYVDKPCADGGGKAVQITNNTSTGGSAQASALAAAPSKPLTGTDIPGGGPRPSEEACKKMREPLNARSSSSASKAGNQAIADLAAKIEAAGC